MFGLSDWGFAVIFFFYIPFVGYVIGKSINDRIDRLEENMEFHFGDLRNQLADIDKTVSDISLKQD